MAPSSSSTRKAARLAQKGKGRRVRFQGGTLFPLVVAIVVVLGLGLVVYARASRPENVPPQPNVDHWHSAYGFQLCEDSPTVQLTGDLEQRDAQGNLIGNDVFITTGVHSHNDGVIHWHPYGSRAAGRNAQLGVFFDNYDVDLDDDRLELPEGGIIVDGGAPPEDFPLVYEEGETECDGEDAELTVVVWENFNDPDSQQAYTSGFGDIEFRDSQVVVVAFVPEDVDVVMPTWAADLPRLGAIDSGAVPTTTPPGESVPTESTEPAGSTEPEDSTDTTESSESTEPVTETTTETTTESTTPSSTTEG